jgi:hypothetical protein
MKKNEYIIKRNKAVFKTIGKKTFILDKNNENLLELNSTASLIWKNLSKPVRFSQLVNIILDKFNVSKKTAEKDLEKILHKLKKRKIVSIKNLE